MKNASMEVAVGSFIVAGMAALLFLAIKVSGISLDSNRPVYHLFAHFQNIAGLSVRARVTMAGVDIGRVTGISLDQKTLTAKVDMSIYQDMNQISTDSVASILTSGLLGEKYIGIVPGADSTNLKNGDEIKQTQSSLVLEDLISKFLFNKATTEKSAPSANSGF
ncbi:MAG: outer membrane lipid asymmetry maintenance protein MlaD [Pseudomonadales bacterium]|nr:outer membrane lipid asymmetry maintenance protein MlaD [Pseudomonadales bacterium]